VPTVTELIRQSLESKIRPDPNPRPSLQELRATQWSSKFEQYMRNRLVIGGIRYETFDEKRRGHSYRLLDSVRKRLDRYEQTGNQEYLVDSANCLMIEFECPTVPGTHFHATDDELHVEKD
jgi:hypothetical protein